jgi:voltage-gated potassium channel Kch
VVEHVTVDNHIIVFGNDSNLTMFISELRRPSVKGSSYHPLVIVCPTLPSKWEAIRGRYNDIYVLLGAFTRSAVFNRANVEQAFAVILLATEDGITTVTLLCPFSSPLPLL